VEILVFPNAETVAQRAAELVSEFARKSIAARGQFTFASSGGKTPWLMFEHLTKHVINWELVHLFQVDERVAPAGDTSRNWTHLQESLLSRVAMPSGNAHAIPVEADTPELAATLYGQLLLRVAGTPAVLDLIHLGLGPDGHTASLVPGDPILSVDDVDVAATNAYQGQRRVTLTFPMLNRARHILWVVAGSDKQEALGKLLVGDRSIPAGRVNGARSTVLADSAAIGRR
jgi:6-phosphogluconolactonase